MMSGVRTDYGVSAALPQDSYIALMETAICFRSCNSFVIDVSRFTNARHTPAASLAVKFDLLI